MQGLGHKVMALLKLKDASVLTIQEGASALESCVIIQKGFIQCLQDLRCYSRHTNVLKFLAYLLA